MVDSADSSAPHDELPFRYVGGEPSLDLVNTVNWTSRGLEAERLTDYSRLLHWAEGAGVVGRRGAALLRRAAAERPTRAREVHAEALRLRGVLGNVFTTTAHGGPTATALAELEAPLDSALRQLRLGRVTTPGRTARAVWEWRDARERLDSILWPVVWSAAKLLTGEEAQRIRVCDGPDCGWVFVDRSRNRLRRWCEMETCGTHAKTRRRARRLRA